MSQVLESQDDILNEYDRLLSSPRAETDPFYVEIMNEFLKKYLDVLVCDGCGRPIKTPMISSLHKNHQSNPLDRRIILHLSQNHRCKIRVCNSCGETNQMVGKNSCVKCKKPIEHKTTEPVWR